MANMAYCRMANTAEDLQDCVDHWKNELVSRAEKNGKLQIIRLAKELLEMEGYEIIEEDCFERDNELFDDDLE